jgi:hypothetical protein
VTARECFVPQRVGQLTEELAARSRSTDPSAYEHTRVLSRLVAALFHFDFQARAQAVTEAWDCVNEDPEAAALVLDELDTILNEANYVRVTMAELDDALERESPLPLRLEVDLDDYDEVLVYRRGSRPDTITVPRWGGLRSEQREVTVYERVVVYTRVKPLAWFDEQGIDPSARHLVPGHVSLKQFKNVPRADIEMLLPSTQVRFRPIDRMVVGVPAVVSGIVVLTTKLLPTLGLVFLVAGAWLGLRDEHPDLDQGALVALFGGLVALGGFLARQWSKLKNRKVKYLQMLADRLYFHTIADGPGVVHMLLFSAQEQEVIEVLLAYHFLLEAEQGLSQTELDQRVEQWLHERTGQPIDFDVDDAVGKLRNLDLVEGDRHLRVPGLSDALAHLDRRWDGLFQYDTAR